MSQQFTVTRGRVGGAAGEVTRYFFLQNPSAMSVPKRQLNTMDILEGRPVHQYPWGHWSKDRVHTMSWENAPLSIYTNLETFARRDNLGNIPIAFLYDGDMGEFPTRIANPPGPALLSGTPVKLLSVSCEPLLSFFDISDVAPKTATHRVKIDLEILKVT